MIHLRDVRLPEFDKNRKISTQKALIFDGPCKYDIIFGADFLTKIGMVIDYRRGEVEWYGNNIKMREPWGLTNQEFLHMCDSFFIQEEEAMFGDDWLDCYAVEKILDAKYDKLDIEELMSKQNHLDTRQKEQLRDLFLKYSKVFDGTLGLYPHKKVHIEVLPDAKPRHMRPYAVPRVHMDTFKKELDHLVKIGVLSPQGMSKWAMPTFIIPKKDGRVRWVSDLRALNEVVVRRQYPLPIIKDVLKKRNGYKFFSKVDVSMQYYTFELDEESKDLCTIITPYGKYKYNRLPMGLKCSPDIAQECMEDIFREIEDTEVYIDDIGAFSKSWEQHLDLLDKILYKLQINGFTVNPLKCEWGVKETDWLGYWLTPVGLKPWKKKIDAILKMEPPKSAKQLRGFIGAVKYYRDMWPRRAHVLAPLTDATGKYADKKKKVKFEWTPEMDKAFKQMKVLLATDALTFYPDHNKPFRIYTDASDYQMGACIMQQHNGIWRPVAYYSRKLNSAQKNYTTMEKELLAIVTTLKEFRSTLLGADITVYTDHKNLTFENLQTQRVIRWRLYLEEFGPKLKYIQGEKNVVADTLSRLDRKENISPIVGKNDAPCSDIKDDALDNFYSVYDDSEIAEVFMAGMNPKDNLSDLVKEHDCFLNLAETELDQHPLNLENIKELQDADEGLQKLKDKHPNLYFLKDINQTQNVLCYVRAGKDKDKSWKIVLPDKLLKSTIKWFHIVTGHSGWNRLYMTISARYYNPALKTEVRRFRCAACQKHKLSGKGYGLLPERELKEQPFDEVAVDLIGPWEVKVGNKQCVFKALTIIDPVTNLTELVRVKDKTAKEVAGKFSQTWLTRYPWPMKCIHDNGGEFTGWEFQQLLEQCNIKDTPTTSRNPTANAICERMHQTVGNVLRTLVHQNPPRGMRQAKDLVDEALAVAQHALRCAVHTTLGSSPGALVFNRDMFLNIPLMADWQMLNAKREHLVNENLRRANLKRRRFDYAVNQKVLKKLHAPTKMGEMYEGPYNIEQVHVNGNVTMQLRPGVTERINIRRIIPYHPPT